MLWDVLPPTHLEPACCGGTRKNSTTAHLKDGIKADSRPVTQSLPETYKELRVAGLSRVRARLVTTPQGDARSAFSRITRT